MLGSADRQESPAPASSRSTVGIHEGGPQHVGKLRRVGARPRPLLAPGVRLIEMKLQGIRSAFAWSFCSLPFLGGCVLGSSQDARAPTSGVKAVAQPETAHPTQSKSEITRAELEAHVRYLASDEMGGRNTGSPQAERAARYLAGVLERSGLKPAGDNGTFLQSVPMERTRVAASPELRLKTRSGATLQPEFGPDFDLPMTSISADELPIVFVASAAQIPAQSDAQAALFVDASEQERRMWLSKAGNPTGAGWGLLIKPGSTRPARAKSAESSPWRVDLKANGDPHVVWLKINGPLLDKFRKGEIERISLATHVEREAVPSFNVVGLVPGRGLPEHPEIADEIVVVSAHYDHLGEMHDAPQPENADATASGGAPAKIDRIFNGADDDASGVAAVLELAGAFAHGPPPARTLVFLLATGEEIGLLGTLAYLDHPTLPLDRTVANLNFEMIGRPDPKVGGAGVMWLTGFDLTNLGPAYEAAGLAIHPDPRPEQHFFERSDNYAFVRRGLVGQTFSTYNLHEDYHSPRDEADRIDYAHMEVCVRAGHQAVKMLADGGIRPQWLPGKQPGTGR